MKLFKNPLLWVFLLALFVRIYNLEVFPVGLHVDEIKVGWNALSILTTGKDDHLHILKLYYDTFGDYRPSGIFYLTVPFVYLFGKTIFAIRFASAFFGALTVFPIFGILRSVEKNRDFSSKSFDLALIGAGAIALSPWHIEVSRATSEAAISMFFTLTALYFFINYFKKHKPSHVFYSLTSITIAYFFYHSIRLLAPLFYIVTTIYFYKKSRQTNKKHEMLGIPIFATLFVFCLTVLFGISAGGVARLNQVKFFKDVDIQYELGRVREESKNKNRIIRLIDSEALVYTRNLILNYSEYFSGGFLIGKEARPYRYATPGSGLLNFTELILFVLGVIEILKAKRFSLPLMLLLISPFPSVITTEDVPNLHRAFFMVAFISMVVPYGLEAVLKLSKKYFHLVKIMALFAILINSALFFHAYFNHSVTHKPLIKNFFIDGSTYRNVGTIELVKKIEEVRGNYDKVVVTNFPDSPYPWYAFFTNKNPGELNLSYSDKTNSREYSNIIFTEDKCPSDYAFTKFKEKNILVINSWECPQENQIKSGLPAKITHKILREDGSEVFIFLERI